MLQQSVLPQLETSILMLPADVVRKYPIRSTIQAARCHPQRYPSLGVFLHQSSQTTSSWNTIFTVHVVILFRDCNFGAEEQIKACFFSRVLPTFKNCEKIACNLYKVSVPIYSHHHHSFAHCVFASHVFSRYLSSYVFYNRFICKFATIPLDGQCPGDMCGESTMQVISSEERNVDNKH